MEETRFETLARVLGLQTTRRLTLGALLGSAFDRSHPGDVEARNSSGKCKPACGECQICDTGKCEKKHGKKRCNKGKCKPKGAGISCTVFAGGVCQNGACINLQADETNCGALGTVCGPTQVCQAGSCFPVSICPATAVNSCGSDAVTCGTDCFCSQSAEGNVFCFQNEGFCLITPPGSPVCASSADCPAGEACVDITGCCAPALPPGTKTCLAPCVAPTA